MAKKNMSAFTACQRLSMVRNTSHLTTPPVSKEYGAWASLFIAFLIGVGIAKRINLEALILFLGALSFFLARIPSLSILRFKFTSKTDSPELARQVTWFTLYSFTGVISFSILLFIYELTDLLIFIILSLIIFSYNIYVTYKKGTRAKEASISGVLGVSLLSPFAYYVASGRFDNVVATLWILVFLHLAGGILYVEARLGVFNWQSCFVFHIITAVVVIMLSILKLIPPLALAAYLPAFIKSYRGAALVPEKGAGIRKLGRMEFYHSIIFAFILIVIYSVR